MQVYYPQTAQAKELISSIVYLNTAADGMVLPKSYAEIVFNIKAPYLKFDKTTSRFETSPNSWLTGLQSAPFRIRPVGETACFVVRLKPWAQSLLFDMPAHEFARLSVNLEDFLQRGCNHIIELIETNPVERSFEIIENYFLKLMKDRPKQPKFSVNELHYLETLIKEANVEYVCKKLNISRKHLNVIFNYFFGCSPKQYQGLLRFNAALGGLAREKPDGGFLDYYYDQPHFIHDFKKYSGLTPLEYLKRREEIPFPSLHFLPGR